MLDWWLAVVTNLTTLIATACALKQQMNDHVATLYQRINQPEAFSREQRDAGKVLTKQYAPAIRKIVEASSIEELTARRDRLDARLNKGWAYCHLHSGDAKAHEAWEALLLEYEVLCDAVNHVNITAEIGERLNRIGRMVPVASV